MQDLEIVWKDINGIRTPISLTMSESTFRHQKDILEAQKGDFKFSPQIGVGLTNQLLGTMRPDALMRSVYVELEGDGLPLDNIKFQ